MLLQGMPPELAGRLAHPPHVPLDARISLSSPAVLRSLRAEAGAQVWRARARARRGGNAGTGTVPRRPRQSGFRVPGAQVHISVATRKMPQGVRTLPEILALAQGVKACPSLHLRGIMTHGGDFEARGPARRSRALVAPARYSRALVAPARLRGQRCGCRAGRRPAGVCAGAALSSVPTGPEVQGAQARPYRLQRSQSMRCGRTRAASQRTSSWVLLVVPVGGPAAQAAAAA